MQQTDDFFTYFISESLRMKNRNLISINTIKPPKFLSLGPTMAV